MTRLAERLVEAHHVDAAEFMHLMTVSGSRGIPPRAPAHRLKPHDLDQSGRSTAAQWRIMAFDLRRLSVIEVAAIAIIVLSVAVLAFVGFSILAEP